MEIKGIGLSAKMRVGKDTVRNALCEIDPRFYKLGFSNRLKELAGQITGLDFFDEEIKVKHRQFLIDFGTKLMRNWDEDFWVKEFLKAATRKEGIPVVADVRFVNEAETLRKNGFLMVRLIANEKTMRRRGWIPDFDNDPSEAELNNYTKWDLIVDTSDDETGTHDPRIDAEKILELIFALETMKVPN